MLDNIKAIDPAPTRFADPDDVTASGAGSRHRPRLSARNSGQVAYVNAIAGTFAAFGA